MVVLVPDYINFYPQESHHYVNPFKISAVPLTPIRVRLTHNFQSLSSHPAVRPDLNGYTLARAIQKELRGPGTDGVDLVASLWLSLWPSKLLMVG